jgi:hypothetical protein
LGLSLPAARSLRRLAVRPAQSRIALSVAGTAGKLAFTFAAPLPGTYSHASATDEDGPPCNASFFKSLRRLGCGGAKWPGPRIAAG